MVCVNPQSMEKDVASVEPGGYFLYDNTKPLAQHLRRDDITYFGVPLTEMCMREYENQRLQQLLKNVVYVGVLAALLDMGGSDGQDARGATLFCRGDTDALQFLLALVHSAGHGVAVDICSQHLAHRVVSQSQLCAPVVSGVDNGFTRATEFTAIRVLPAQGD